VKKKAPVAPVTIADVKTALGPGMTDRQAETKLAELRHLARTVLGITRSQRVDAMQKAPG